MTGKRAKLTQFLNQQYLCASLTVKEVETLLDYTELVEVDKDQIIADIKFHHNKEKREIVQHFKDMYEE